MTELAVLVPVLNRPQNVAPLVESFLANCPEGSRLYFLLTAGDEAEKVAVHEGMDAGDGRVFARADTWVTWPQKIAKAPTCIEANWYLCAADDIEFTNGWWEATEELRNDERIGVIGTNDSSTGSGNPRVASGEHTCHPLIRADYIRDAGTIDELGAAVHGGYHHWYVDDELIYTAKYRNAWAYCKDAVIEHLHPYWGRGEWDDTYTRGEANAEADKALFISRAHLFGVAVQ